MAVTLVAGLGGLAPLTAGAAAAVTSPAKAVAVSPSPGERFATPQTAISFRGITPAALGTIRVTGSRSGVHAGRLVADPAGYTIWKPRVAFAPGERVTVHTAVGIAGAGGDSFSFAVAHIAPHAATMVAPESWTGAGASASATPSGSAATSVSSAPAAACKAVKQTFHTEPGLIAPAACVNQAAHGTAPGKLFVTPDPGSTGASASIFDNHGNLIWFAPDSAHNLQPVTYQGQHMLAFYQGNPNGGHKLGEDVLMNDHYQVVAYIRGGDGDIADGHELTITKQGNALIGCYVPVTMNLTAYGGTANQVVWDYVVQELDVTTGNVLFSWDSLDHVPVNYSEYPVPKSGRAFDYFHGNSISLTSDGNLLISGRTVSAVYKVNMATGKVAWELGGRHPSFKLLPAGSQWFCYQHDSRQPEPNVVTVFDDGEPGPSSCPHHPSRGLALTLDTAAHTATITRALNHSPQLDARFLGSYQSLSHGDALVDWGEVGEVTEYNAANQPNFDMSFTGKTYRAYRAPWTGIPNYPPAVATAKGTGGAVKIFASWNGDTQVANWQILAGQDGSSLSPVGPPQRKKKFETKITVQTTAPVVAAEALDSSGKVLATSAAVPVSYTPPVPGYYVGTQDGHVYNFGAPAYGSPAGSGQKPSSPLVGTVVPPKGKGYYLPSAAGDVYNFKAPFFGSLPKSGIQPPTPVVGLGAYRGSGYYLATSGGNVYNFGKAPFDGSPQSSGKNLTSPVSGIAVDPKGGYWLVTQDGRVFNYGAPSFGSEKGKSLPAPVVGIAAEPSGKGYLLVTSDGHVYPFGQAPSYGSPATSVVNLSSKVVGIATLQPTNGSPQSTGYFVVCANGDVYNYGVFLPSSPNGLSLPAPIDGLGAG